MLKQKQTR